MHRQVVQSAVNVQPLVEQVVEHNVCALLVIGRACTTCLGQAWAARVAPVEQPLALERHEHTADLLLPLTEHTGKAVTVQVFCSSLRKQSKTRSFKTSSDSGITNLTPFQIHFTAERMPGRELDEAN